MAFTKITGYGISETTDLHVGLITSTHGVKGVGIFSGGTAIHSGIITSLNFVGTGNTFAVAGGKVDISIAGGAGGAVGAGADKVFYENDITVAASYSVSSGKNAMSAGPITLASGVTVTIPNGSVWSVV